jgi:hypothetical protein
MNEKSRRAKCLTKHHFPLSAFILAFSATKAI